MSENDLFWVTMLEIGNDFGKPKLSKKYEFVAILVSKLRCVTCVFTVFVELWV